MLSLTSALVSAAAVIIALVNPIAVTAASSTVGPNPAQVYINGITYGGSGCPQGSMSSFISDDRQTSVKIENPCL